MLVFTSNGALNRRTARMCLLATECLLASLLYAAIIRPTSTLDWSVLALLTVGTSVALALMSSRHAFKATIGPDRKVLELEFLFRTVSLAVAELSGVTGVARYTQLLSSKTGEPDGPIGLRSGTHTYELDVGLFTSCSDVDALFRALRDLSQASWSLPAGWASEADRHTLVGKLGGRGKPVIRWLARTAGSSFIDQRDATS